MTEITITFKDGKKGSFNKGITPGQILKEIKPTSSSQYIAAVVNDQIVDLSSTINQDATLNFLTCSDPEGLQVFWHSASHVMAAAVKIIFPDAKLGIGPSISNGFYYDFTIQESLSPDDFIRIEEKMREIVDADYPFVRESISKKDAIELFKERNESFKLELIQDIPDDEISIYRNNGFVDLCRGPHVPSTGYVTHFKLLNLAGAYWHGDERNPMMQRIYGIAFPDQKSLKKHLLAIEEAKKRDHRRLGKELDLFSFQSEGPGFAFWHPNGMIIYNEIMRYMHETLEKHGYDEIKTPIILNEELWHRSGHWDNYKGNMYFTSIDEQTYAVKPMNCPGGLLVFKNNPHSYRDLPIKMSEMGLVHRNEKSGVLHGLFRVRQFTQDDAHVYCTPDQLEEEIINLIELVEEVYQAFGYEDYQAELSTKPLKSIGSEEMWKKAEFALKNALDKKQVEYQINPGEGAFYGPKIDYHIRDSLGRLWQCGTIQVDFSMPERFDLEYVGSDGEKHRPVMLHRAILGSVERFIGILIEHYGGAFPVWLAPVQCMVMPISEKHHDYAVRVNQMLRNNGIRSRIDRRNEKIGYKIRESESNKVPFMAVVGDNEIQNESVSLRKRRSGDQGTKPAAEMILEIKDSIDRRINH